MDQKFEHLSLEKDIERLAAEIKGRIAPETPEVRRETVKEVLGEKIYSVTQSQLSKMDDATESSVLPDYLQKETVEVKLKVEQLVDVAWHNGIAAAANEAKKIGPFYVDALHDALTDKLYGEFKKRGLL